MANFPAAGCVPVGCVGRRPSTSFSCKSAAYHDRLLRDDSQIRAGSRFWLSAALLPFLQRALTDAVGSREFSLRHFHLLANGFHVDRLRPNLLQFDFAALV